MIVSMRVDATNLQPLRQILLERSAHHSAESAACVEQAAASRRRAAALRSLAEVIARQRELVDDERLDAILLNEAETFGHEARLSETEASRHDAEAARAAAQADTARSEAAALVARH